jgi:predicted RNA polymerase sigma factor
LPQDARIALALREVCGLTTEEIAAKFTGAKADIVRRHLDILRVMGEVKQNPDGRYQAAT